MNRDMQKIYTLVLTVITIVVIIIFGSRSVNKVIHIGSGGCGTTSDSGEKTTKEWDVENFDKFDLDIRVGAVTVKCGDRNHVEFIGSESLIPSVKVEKNTLYISQENKKTSNVSGKIIITVKKDNFDTLSVYSNVGEVKIEESITFSNINIETNVGEVCLKNVICTGTADILTDVGAINLKDCDFRGDANLKTDVGEVVVKDSFPSQDTFKIRTDVGSINYYGETVKKKLDISGNSTVVSITSNVGSVTVK